MNQVNWKKHLFTDAELVRTSLTKLSTMSINKEYSENLNKAKAFIDKVRKNIKEVSAEAYYFTIVYMFSFIDEEHTRI